MNFTSLQTSILNTKLEGLSAFIDEDFLKQLKHGDFPRWRELIRNLPRLIPSEVQLHDAVIIGRSQDCNDSQREAVEASLRDFMPWRKGPFQLFGIDIDSEWRSQLKWDRLLPFITPLQDRTVLDVGCGNGYHCLRMTGAGAKLVIGIDPHLAYVAQFWALKHFVQHLPTYVIPAALEQLPQAMHAFDTTFSMGVIYHRRSPIDHLVQLKNTLKPGGELVLETLYVDGPLGYSLTPSQRYARMSNVWFIPSIATLINWLERCGFINIQVVDKNQTEVQEQRQTSWMPYQSLHDSLDPKNPDLTIEGLDAPKRVVIIAHTK